MSEKSKKPDIKSKTSSKDANKDKKSISPPKKDDKKEEKKTVKKTDTKSKKPENSLMSKNSNNDSRLDNKDGINKSQLETPTTKDKFNDSNIFDIMNTKKTTNRGGKNTKYVEKCEGCFEIDGVCFCVACEKVYCKMCEAQIHMVPSNMNHER